MSKAAELAALIGSQSALSNRNLVINGAMTISQRGTSQTGITNDGYKKAPDRFKVEANSAGTWTVSQSTNAPDGFSNSYKFDCTTANASLSAGSSLRFVTRLEGQDLQHLKKGTSGAESITLSFWVRSAKTGTYIVQLKDQDNDRIYSQAYTISSADTWEHKVLTFAGDTTGAFDNDNVDSLRVFWWLAAGTNFSSGTLATDWQANVNADRAVGQVNLADSTSNDWYITGVQLEVGEQATPFEHEPYGVTLQKAQRYYSEIGSRGTARSGRLVLMNNNGTTGLWGIHTLPNTMRAEPSVTTLGGGTSGGSFNVNGNDGVTTSVSSIASFQNGLNSISGNVQSISSGASGYWIDLGTDSHQLLFTLDAEL
jgi:hypothetical protein